MEKAAKLTFMIAIITLMAMTHSYGQKHHRRFKHKSYDCHKVGVQKVHHHKYSKKESSQWAAHIHHASVAEMAKKAREEKKENKVAEVEKPVLKTIKRKPKTDSVKIVSVDMPKPVYFRFDSEELEYVDIYQIGLAVEHARQGKFIHLCGHTDNEGSDEYNVELSLQRAKHVKEMMLAMDNSLDASKITIDGKGEKEPAVANDTPAHRLSNRRVEFTVK